MFVVSAAAAGSALGALLGAIGALIPEGVRWACVTLLTLSASYVGARELLGRQFLPWQRNRETPRVWLDQSSMWWAAKNGAALGVGVTSRVGFWVFYVVPLGVVFIGEQVWGPRFMVCMP